jgi:phosphoglycerol transferase MdoB-like AlkP superfamily enzyme
MRKRLLFLLATGIFWVGFFEVLRLIFVCYQRELVQDLNTIEILKAFIHGLYHDLSLAGYILLLTGLILSLTFWLPGKKLSKLFGWITVLLLLVSSSILIPNLELYRNWGFHLDATVLSYLKNPKEAAASTQLSVYIGLTLLFLASLVGGFLAYRKFVLHKLKAIQPMKVVWVPAMLFVTAAMIIPVRGGVGIAPMNVGFVYFSNTLLANHIAVNPVWNFSYSMKKLGKDQKEYKFLSQEQMQTTIRSLKAEKQDPKSILKTKRPNVVVLVLESFTSKVIEQLGGEKGVTPNFARLSKEGVLFNNFYAIGDRSKIGLVGLLSGYPSLPQRSVISYARKTEKIPSLCRRFTELGYSSTYYYGGDLRFASMNSYISTMGFQNIVTYENFPDELNVSKWGVNDEFVFDALLEDIRKEEDSFFKVFFTLSSHEPFEVPMETVIQGKSEDARFMNSVYYTDKCLGNFIEKLKQDQCWENTLLILVADHGVRYIGRSQPHDLIKYHIPMLWLGGALEEEAKGTLVDKIGCQPDMSNTLLAQMELDNQEFIFGKDLLNDEQKGYAFFDFNNGFGYVDENGASVYDLNSNDFLVKEGAENQNWKAILQFLSKDFKER